MVLSIFLWLISWWNVENLFDTHHDSLKNDLEYTAEGVRHWTPTRYRTKVDNIARVICNIGGWEQPLLVGLGEVENDYCLRSLCYALVQYPYRAIHFESPDERGIDVALLYDTTRFVPLSAEPLAVPLDGDYTRDILYVTGTTVPPIVHCQPSTVNRPTDTLHCFFCHLPSMLGGAKATEWKRQRAKTVIQQRVDSLLQQCPNAKIIVMGDMNCNPQNDLQGLTNCMLPYSKRGEGTHYYQGLWSCLDQCYLSPSLSAIAQVSIFRPSWMLVPSPDGLDSIPRRTFHGFHYDRGGFSDHLPIVLTTP
ncbi:MAG: hypothetical protein MJZ65_00905 [Paludibacteraceae bacterium]|nr:hypothetical protein [Paludibacteraceae bacterium]